MDPGPVLGICGYSGAGKTTLIETLVRTLTSRGLAVGVVKHDAHGVTLDPAGKDTDRIFRAGADVLLDGPDQLLMRIHRRGDAPLADTLQWLAPYFDLILVEGHKTTPLEHKIWLCGAAGERPPPTAVNIRRVLKRSEDRVRIVLELLDDWLPAAWLATPLYAGILLGGRSMRMGRPKHLCRTGGATWVERAVASVRGCVRQVVLLGRGVVPARLRVLPALSDVEDATGPLRGMLAALRWAPRAAWLFVPCDAPLFTVDAAQWLLSHRRPGVWAILPRRPGAAGPEPLPAYYNFRAARYLERVRGPVELAAAPHVLQPLIPPELADAWTNVNTPAEQRALRPPVVVGRVRSGPRQHSR